MIIYLKAEKRKEKIPCAFANAQISREKRPIDTTVSPFHSASSFTGNDLTVIQYWALVSFWDSDTFHCDVIIFYYFFFFAKYSTSFWFFSFFIFCFWFLFNSKSNYDHLTAKYALNVCNYVEMRIFNIFALILFWFCFVTEWRRQTENSIEGDEQVLWLISYTHHPCFNA